MKYKIIGILDIFFGSLYVLSQAALLLFVYPKMFNLYQDMDIVLPIYTRYAALFSIGFIVIFFSVVIVGIKLLTKPTNALFKLGVMALVFLLLLSGYFTATSVLGAVVPLYTITSSL